MITVDLLSKIGHTTLVNIILPQVLQMKQMTNQNTQVLHICFVEGIGLGKRVPQPYRRGMNLPAQLVIYKLLVAQTFNHWGVTMGFVLFHALFCLDYPK